MKTQLLRAWILFGAKVYGGEKIETLDEGTRRYYMKPYARDRVHEAGSEAECASVLVSLYNLRCSDDWSWSC